MSDPVLSDGTGVLLARESSLGVQPTAGWQQIQINPGGITEWTRDNVEVDRAPLSPNLTPEAGEVVGYNVAPKLAGDLTRDMMNVIREPMFRSLTKHAGGKGQSRYPVTGVTSTGFTVASLGDLPNGTLIKATGFTNAANNGLHVLAGTSTTTEIKTTGLVVEASPPANAIVEVAGVQGASADIELVAGNLTSTILDFTTLGLVPGQMIVIGDATSGAAFAFATAAYNAGAIIAGPITAHSIPLMMREWTVAADDTGTGKTIRILYTRCVRNVPLTDADYITKPSLAGEISEPGAGTLGATDYTYGLGLGLDQVDINIPVEGKVDVTLSFVGMKMSDPGASRATGADVALAPLQTGLFQTADKMTGALVKKSDESSLSVDINGLKITYKNNITPMKELFVGGAANLIYGAYMTTLSMDAYVIDNNLTRAANANTSAMLRARVKNADGGLGLFFPLVKLRKPKKTYAAHTSVMIANDVGTFRDPATGLMQTLSEFAYLP